MDDDGTPRLEDDETWAQFIAEHGAFDPEGIDPTQPYGAMAAYMERMDDNWAQFSAQAHARYDERYGLAQVDQVLAYTRQRIDMGLFATMLGHAFATAELAMGDQFLPPGFCLTAEEEDGGVIVCVDHDRLGPEVLLAFDPGSMLVGAARKDLYRPEALASFMMGVLTSAQGEFRSTYLQKLVAVFGRDLGVLQHMTTAEIENRMDEFGTAPPPVGFAVLSAEQVEAMLGRITQGMPHEEEEGTDGTA